MNFLVKRLEEKQIQQTVNRLSQISGENVHISADIFCLQDEVGQKYVQDILALKNLIQCLPSILRKDINAAIEHWNVHPTLTDLIKKDIPSTLNMFRPDIVMTESGPKVVEFNVDLGALGIQTGVFAKSLYRNLSLDWFTADEILKNYWQSQGRKKVIVWDILRAENDNYGRHLLGIFQRFQLKLKMMTSNEILSLSNEDLNDSFITRIFADARFIENSILAEHAEEISKRDAAFTVDFGVKNVLIDSKISLAILWELVRASALSPQDISLVQTYIPETYILNSESLKLARANKDHWVLKSAHGFQGSEVHIGTNMTEEDWLKILAELQGGDTKAWILQRFESTKPINLGIINGKGLIQYQTSHLFNMFFVNNLFGGALVRASLDGRAKVGPVNGVDCIAIPVVWGK